MAASKLELDGDDVDLEDEVTRGDLVAFGRQLGDAIFAELDRRDADRRRVEAERERLAPRGNTAATGDNEDDDEAAFRRAAQRAGLSPENYAAAIAAAKKAELKDLVQECLDECLPEALEELIEEMAEEDEPTGRRQASRGSGKPQRNGKTGKPSPSRDAGREPRPPRDSSPGDNAPENLHWSERPLFGKRSS